MDMEGQLTLADFKGEDEGKRDASGLKTKKEVMAIHKRL